VIAVAVGFLVASAALFAYRLVSGPTLADRMVGVNGLFVTGMGFVSAQAVASGRGAFLPVLVVASLVSFVGTGMVARYLEGLRR
jgi:multicomponent Na+:H+ antiporter subunit F